jgi:hypothetical protein
MQQMLQDQQTSNIMRSSKHHNKGGTTRLGKGMKTLTAQGNQTAFYYADNEDLRYQNS